MDLSDRVPLNPDWLAIFRRTQIAEISRGTSKSLRFQLDSSWLALQVTGASVTSREPLALRTSHLARFQGQSGWSVGSGRSWMVMDGIIIINYPSKKMHRWIYQLIIFYGFICSIPPNYKIIKSVSFAFLLVTGLLHMKLQTIPNDGSPIGHGKEFHLALFPKPWRRTQWYVLILVILVNISHPWIYMEQKSN